MYRVLIVDDKQTVLDANKDWIEAKMKIGNEFFVVDLLRLKVDVIEDENGYKISKETLNTLNEYCKTSFDLFLLDFGYVKNGLNTVKELNRLKNEYPDKTIPQLIAKVVLNPSSIVKEALEDKEYNNIKKNFVNHKGKIYVHTYMPNDFEKEYTCIDVRKNVTNGCFASKDIEVIDTKKSYLTTSYLMMSIFQNIIHF